MKVTKPIIISLLDQDFYSFSVGQLVWFEFRDTKVEYSFINRGKTQFPDGFADELKNQVQLLSQIRLTNEEGDWMKKLPHMRREYVDWLASYQFDPAELTITQEDGNLKITINGLWYRTIMWEVVLLALISELYFQLTEQKVAEDWIQRITDKAKNLSDSGCKWIDFGTRRRFAFSVQVAVVHLMKSFNGFCGTSNCFLAMMEKVTPMGTMSHQLPMALSALYGVSSANQRALKVWKNFYGDYLSIFLPDTFTTGVFLRDFNYDTAMEWNGLRQDSGNPEVWMEAKVIPHYKIIGVPLKEKTIVFSDNLTDEKFKYLSLKYRNVANIYGGIGTYLTNDVLTKEDKDKGIKPLNMVIKLVSANGKPVVKLSDTDGKYTGNTETINLVKQELKIS